MSYGEFFRTHRIQSGYKSQRKLAEKSGISSATISRIESEIQKPELATMKVLSQYLTSTTFNDLMVVCGYGDGQTLEAEFGEYLRGLRNEKGLTIRELEKATGISNAYLSQIETGKRGKPSPDVIKKIHKVLGVSYEELLFRSGHYVLPSEKRTKYDWESFGLEMEQRGIDPEMLYDLLKNIEKFKGGKIR